MLRTEFGKEKGLITLLDLVGLYLSLHLDMEVKREGVSIRLNRVYKSFLRLRESMIKRP